jgi:2-aminoethylphosphonate-pyruvate transaminase
MRRATVANAMRRGSESNDKTLFTPGPLTTSASVKNAMLRDLGSRDGEFITTVADIRDHLLRLAGVSKDSGWEAIPLQGSGTFAIESVISSVIRARGKLLVAVNGVYGERAAEIATAHSIETIPLRLPENQPLDPAAIARSLDGATHVFAVHCETTTGVLNPITEIGAIARDSGTTYIVDAMSSFGGIPIDVDAAQIDLLISSPNKCIEGVPGFAFVLARRDALLAAEGNARSLSLDLTAQWRGLEANGQFRFTPPTHAILAFHQALRELDEEGGVAGRNARYRTNQQTLLAGMREMRFRELIVPEHQTPIITTFRYPGHPRFSFDTFYQRLSDKGFFIYPGKLSQTDCFRIATIGRIFPADVEALLAAIRETLDQMGLPDGS